MLAAHRIRLDPNNTQTTYLARAAGTARFAYNWALAEWKRQYEACKVDPTLPRPNEAALRRQLNAVKRQQFPWMLEVTKNAPQMAIMQLGEAFKNFFARRARYPQFRKKGQHDRFTLTNDLFQVDGKKFRVPKLGWVRMREALRFQGRIVSATISRVADHWYASITVDIPDPSLPPAENQGVVGIDLGVSSLATLSTGEAIAGPRALRGLLDRLRRLSWGLSRKVGFYEFRRQLEYKAAWRGALVVVADRWYPSSRLCSCCGRRLETLGLDTRRWSRAGCGANHNRGLNAAINLKNMAVSSTASACGGEGAGLARKREAKPAPTKQESSGKVNDG